MTLLQLATRVEEASGPDRELDYAISLAIGKGCVRSEQPLAADYAEETGGLVIPRYTASLDAAMSLVPEGYGWRLWMPNSGSPEHINVTMWGNHREYAPRIVEAATPALALVAAALRALASQEQTARQQEKI